MRATTLLAVVLAVPTAGAMADLVLAAGPVDGESAGLACMDTVCCFADEFRAAVVEADLGGGSAEVRLVHEDPVEVRRGGDDEPPSASIRCQLEYGFAPGMCGTDGDGVLRCDASSASPDGRLHDRRMSLGADGAFNLVEKTLPAPPYDHLGWEGHAWSGTLVRL